MPPNNTKLEFEDYTHLEAGTLVLWEGILTILTSGYVAHDSNQGYFSIYNLEKGKAFGNVWIARYDRVDLEKIFYILSPATISLEVSQKFARLHSTAGLRKPRKNKRR